MISDRTFVSSHLRDWTTVISDQWHKERSSHQKTEQWHYTVRSLLLFMRHFWWETKERNFKGKKDKEVGTMFMRSYSQMCSLIKIILGSWNIHAKTTRVFRQVPHNQLEKWSEARSILLRYSLHVSNVFGLRAGSKIAMSGTFAWDLLHTCPGERARLDHHWMPR